LAAFEVITEGKAPISLNHASVFGQFDVDGESSPLGIHQGLSVQQGGVRASAQQYTLPKNQEYTDKSTRNPNNRRPEIPAIKTVVSWVVEVGVFLLMCWSLLKASYALADGDGWRAAGYLLLSLACFAGCVLLPDTVIGDWGGLPR
jgi:hypothetical protein